MSIFDNDNKNTTIINKTERVVINEGNSIPEMTSNAVYSVVNVLSFLKNEPIIPKVGLSLNSREKYISGKNGAGTILTNDGIIVTYKSNIEEENADYKVVTFGGNTSKENGIFFGGASTKINIFNRDNL